MRPVSDLEYIEYELDSGELRRIYADSWEREDYTASATITQQAVESGSKITDHYKPDPLSFKISLVFSGSPVRGDLDPDNVGFNGEQEIDVPQYPPGPSIFTPRGLTVAAEGLVGKAIGLQASPDVPRTFYGMSFAEDPGRVEKVYRELLEIRAARRLLTVKTTIDIFDNMAIRDMPHARTADDGDSGTITLDLLQLEFVQSDVAVAVPLPLEPRAQAPKNANSGGATPVPEGPKKTAAKALLDKARGL